MLFEFGYYATAMFYIFGMMFIHTEDVKIKIVIACVYVAILIVSALIFTFGKGVHNVDRR